MPRQVVRDFGTCLNTGNFAGSVNCGTIALNNSAVTHAAWVRFNAFQTGSPYISSIMGIETGSGEVNLLRLGDGTLGTNNKLHFVGNFAVGGEIHYQGLITIKPYTWTHVAVTYDMANVILYVNGVQDIATPQTNNISGNSTYRISLSNTGAGRQMNGLIDDVRVYKRALTATEINNLYYGITPASTNFEAWWKFDEGSGTTAIDSTGNGHTGTITSGTYSTNVAFKPRIAVA